MGKITEILNLRAKNKVKQQNNILSEGFTVIYLHVVVIYTDLLNVDCLMCISSTRVVTYALKT